MSSNVMGAGLIDACCMAAAIRVIGNPVSLFEQHSDERAADAYRGEQGTRGDWGRRPSQIAHMGLIGQS